MSLRIEGPVVHLSGDCPVEEAEPLAAALEAGDARIVDLSQCRRLHGAVVQALLRFTPGFQGLPEDPFVRDFIIAALTTPALATDPISTIDT